MARYIRAVWAAIALLGLLSASQGAFAQQQVITVPAPRGVAINGSTTIAVTNTFQSVFAAAGSSNRAGCTVQNTGTNPMYVFFGTLADATIATSVKLTAGQSVTCQWGGMVLNTQVSITGTATETFFAALQ